MKKNDQNTSSLISIFCKGRKRLLPTYLWVLWSVITLLMFLGNFFNFIDLSSFSISSYLSVCIAGLSFTFALFNISKSSFNNDELKKIAEYEGKLPTGRNIRKGTLLAEYLSPFLLTVFVLVVAATIALIVPFISLKIDYSLLNYLKISYLSLLLLGIFSLFNLTCMAVEDLYNSIRRP